MFNKKNIELSSQEIWIRIRFLEINGSPSLEKSQTVFEEINDFLTPLTYTFERKE